MEISERCKKQIEDMEKLANEFKVLGESEPHEVVMWDRDFESITELYTAYKLLVDENNDLHKNIRDLRCNINHLRQCNGEQYRMIQELKKQLTDFEESEDRCATLEAENKKLKDKVGELHTIKKSFEVLRALYLGDYEDEPF